MSRDLPHVLRAVRAARGAAFLGSRAAARAAAAELSNEGTQERLGAACVLAAQSAKNAFQTDLAELWRELEAGDHFVAEVKQTNRPRRRRQQATALERLPVETAKAVPILELLQRYGQQFRRTGQEWATCCPFHDDRCPSLRVNSAKGLWHCHVCGIGGDAITFVMRRKGLDFTAAVREIAA